MRRVDRQAEQDTAGLSSSRVVSGSPVLLAAGNQAAARMASEQPRVFAQLWSLSSMINSAMDTVTGIAGEVVHGLADQELRGSVGAEGDNHPGDVMIVMRLLAGAGYGDSDITAAITRFQSEVVKLPDPDGRVDRKGRTFKALKRHQAASKENKDTESGGVPAPVAPAPSAGGGSIAADPVAIDAELNALAALEKKAMRGRKTGEETGPERDQLVERIGEVRKAINGIADAKAKAAFFARLARIAPYYTQWDNKSYLLPGDTGNSVKNSTCNITTVAMALEHLGKSVDDYVGDKAKLTIVEKWVEGKTGSGINTGESRLPDFLQLASIVENLKSNDPTDEEIGEARRATFGGEWILQASSLRTLFTRFGVKTSYIASPEADDLRSIGKKYRTGLEKVASAHEKAGQAGESSVVTGGADVKDADKHEVKVELAGYKAWVQQKFTPLHDAGQPVCVGMYNHWVRLQEFNDEYVTINDPGGGARLNRKYDWEAARAIGLFWHAIVAKA